MARSRNIKPGFFVNEQLGDLEPLTRLLFIGLWTLADKKGRLEDRPRRIHVSCLPYDQVNVDSTLDQLQINGFIHRYADDNGAYIQIINWDRHQSPHYKETDSVIPDPPKIIKKNQDDSQRCANVDSTSSQRRVNQSASCPPDSLNLIPDSLNLIPDSLNSDSLNSDTKKRIKTARTETPASNAPAKIKKTSAKAPTTETWNAYKSAYFERYGTEPVRNASVNAKLKQFVERVGIDQSPQIAAYYLGLSTRWYVEKLHPVGLMVSDAEALHTQWATGIQVTGTQARHEERTSHNAKVVREVIAEETKRHA